MEGRAVACNHFLIGLVASKIRRRYVSVKVFELPNEGIVLFLINFTINIMCV